MRHQVYVQGNLINFVKTENKANETEWKITDDEEEEEEKNAKTRNDLPLHDSTIKYTGSKSLQIV